MPLRENGSIFLGQTKSKVAPKGAIFILQCIIVPNDQKNQKKKKQSMKSSKKFI